MTSTVSRNLRLIAVCVVILGAFASLAAGANAETEWRIGGKTLKALGANEVGVTGKLTESLRLAIPWYASEITCSSATSEGAKIVKGGSAPLTLNLSSCVLSGPPFVAETCKLVEPFKLKFSGLAVSHSGSFYDLLKASEVGKPITVIEFKEKTECPLPLKNEVTGTTVAAFESGERSEQPLTFNTTTEALFKKDALLFGSHPATLKGKETLSLNSPYEGKSWTPAEAPAAPQAGEFKIAGKTFAERKIEEATVSAVMDGTFSVAIPGLSYEVNCTGLTTTSAKLELAGVAKTTFLLTKCTPATTTTLELIPGCELPSGDLTMSVKFSVVRYDAHVYLLAEPSASVTFVENGKCTLFNFNISGSLGAELGKEAVTQKIEFDSASTLGKEISNMLEDKQVFGAQPMTMKLTLLMSLNGPNEGLGWQGV